ncbi:MAG: DUF2341 domain-containing protein [Candidatus Aenigmarchaeota archaeon]|nr:DUF2341 domain-containing protein [Candidatus Aenigmarchaeota archaeon]
MQNRFSVKFAIVLLLVLTISLGVVVAATITIPVRIHQQRQSLCVNSDHYLGELADINQLNCLDSGNPFHLKYGVGKIYVKSLSNDTGLILQLPFDNCVISDISGLGNNPTENNITCVDSLFGGGMEFNGIDSKLIIPYNPSLDSTRITISLWAKIDEIVSTETIIAKSDYPSSGYFLRIEPGTNNGVKITFFVGDSTGSPHEVVADNQDIIGKWVHLVAVYDGAEQAIWINGKKVAYVTWSGDIGLNTKNLEVGDKYGSNYFNGVIDEIAIYNRGLSENEIKTLFYDKLLLLTSAYDAKYILNESEKVSDNRFEAEIFLNNQYYLNKTFTLEVPVPDDANASVFYPYVSGYVDIKELSGIGHGWWNYSIEKFNYGVKNRLIINATLAGADGFDNGIKDYNPDTFFYKREITINNSANNQNLTNYQIKINIDTASLIASGKMNDDCSDIRFYYHDNSTGSEQKIPYWIEPGTCNTTSTEIWIKVPFIPDNQTDIGFGKGIAKVYMYYGNPSATSESNGDAVFMISHTLGSSDSDSFESITSDGTYLYAVGYIGNNVLIVKFDQNLNVVEQKVYDAGDDEQINDVYVDSNYIYVVGSSSFYDSVLMKLDKDLNLISSKVFDVTNHRDKFYSLCSDGTYLYAVGRTFNPDNYELDLLIAKLNKNFNVIDWKLYNGSKNEEFTNVYCDSNGYIYTVGYTGGSLAIIKFNNTLNIVSNKAYSVGDGYLSSVYSDESYVYMVGYYDYYGTDRYFIAKLDKDLNLISMFHSLGVGSDSRFESITSDGTYLYAVGYIGYSEKDVIIFKLDKNLNVISRKEIANADYLNDVYVLDGNLYATGRTNSYGAGSYDATIFKLPLSMSAKIVYPDTFTYTSSGAGLSSVSLSTLDYSYSNISSSYSLVDISFSEVSTDLTINYIYIAKSTLPEPTISIGSEENAQINEIQISTDFLKIIVNKNIYQDKSHPTSITVNDRNNNFLYEINLSNITVDDSKVYELYPNYIIYFYDWENQKWKVWEKGANNSTHSMPNWLNPAFRQEFKWRFSFENNSNTNISLNVTFLVTAHDPFIRMFINAGDQLSSIEHSINIPIKAKEKKYYASIFNNTAMVYDSTNIELLNYAYRKTITINNTLNNQNLTDYQVAINISYDSSMQPDFEDIRFSYYNLTDGSETKIPYWIEQKVDSSWAYVWVKIPFIPDNQTDIGFGNGLAKVYLYYGNPLATSESNASEVFIFYDTIENGNNWIFWGSPTGKVDTSVGNPAPSLKGNGDGWYHSGAVSKISFNLSKGFALMFDGKHSSNLRRGGAGFSTRNSFGTTDSWRDGVQLRLKFDETDDYIGYLVYETSNGTTVSHEDSIRGKDVWRRYEIQIEPNGGKVHFIVDEEERWISTDNIEPFVGYVCIYGHDPEFWFDNIIIREYTYPEPVYSIGTEEVVQKDSPVNVLYDKNTADTALFFTENSKNIGLSLYSTSDNKLNLIEYKNSFSNSENILISLGYTDTIDTTTGNLSTWIIGFSNETLEKVGNSTLTYYDITSWKKSGDYNWIQHNVSLVFHYNNTYKDDYGVGWYNYTGIEDSNSFTGTLISNRSVNGNIHRIVDVGTSSYIVFNLTDHDPISQSDYDQRRIKIVIDYPSQKATYLLLDSLNERYGIRNQNDAYILLANNDSSNQIFLSSSERGLYSFSSNKSSIKEVELNLSAFHTGLTLGYIASDIVEDSNNNNIPDLLEDEKSIGFSSSEKLTDFTKSSLGYYMLGYDGYKFIATFAYLDNEFSYAPFYLLGLKQPVGVENAYEIGYRVSNGATWYMFKSQPIAKFHLNSTSVAQTSNMIKYITFKQNNITIYPEDELYIEGLPTTLSGEGEITYTKSNFLPKAELKLYVKYNQTMSYWVNYILPASADYLIIEISNPEKTYFSMKYNLTDHDKITIPTNNWINDYWYNINSFCYSKNDIKYGMVCSDASPEEVAVALIGGYGIVDSLCYKNDTKYTLSLNTTSDKIIIPLTDNCRMVVSKMRSIQTYGIPTTSFNEETAKSNYVTMTLSYDKIKVLGGLSFSNGYYRLCVRNVGREYGTTLVEIVRC